MNEEIKFDKNQEKAWVNNHGHYQFGSNCCIGCKVDRPINAKLTYPQSKQSPTHLGKEYRL